MTQTMPVTEIAEEKIPQSSLVFRYSRYPAPDGKRWIRHGEFRAFYANGTLASEGTYVHGREEGRWRDFHENGQVAAEGEYRDGRHHGPWRYYDDAGSLEETVEYADGVEVKRPKKKAAAGPPPPKKS